MQPSDPMKFSCTNKVCLTTTRDKKLCFGSTASVETSSEGLCAECKNCKSGNSASDHQRQQLPWTAFWRNTEFWMLPKHIHIATLRSPSFNSAVFRAVTLIPEAGVASYDHYDNKRKCCCWAHWISWQQGQAANSCSNAADSIMIR